MPAGPLNESTVENAALSWFADMAYEVRQGEGIAPGEPATERDAYDQVALLGRLREAVERLNPKIPAEAREEAIRKVLHPESPSLVANNRKFHAMLRDGVEVEYRRRDGSIAGDRVRLIDYDDPDNNDWLVVNQFTVVENHINRRPDVVVFVNGLPLAVIELKNPADEQATVRSAYNQFQTYKFQVPSLFTYNAMLVISDGHEAKIGTLSANWERFSPWRTVEGTDGRRLSIITMPAFHSRCGSSASTCACWCPISDRKEPFSPCLAG